MTTIQEQVTDTSTTSAEVGSAQEVTTLSGPMRLPMPGAEVALTCTDETTAGGRWLGLVNAAVHRGVTIAQPVLVRLYVGGEVRQIQVDPMRLSAGLIVREEVSADQAAAWWAVAAAWIAMDEQDEANAQRMERLVQGAHDYANEADLCGQFDEFMEQYGLRSRRVDWDVDVQVTINVRVRVNSERDEDAAREAVDVYDVREQIQALDLGSYDWQVMDVTEA